MVHGPLSHYHYQNEFVNLVVRSLIDESFKLEWRKKGFEFAKRMRWADSALCLEKVIEEGLNNKSR